MPITLDIITDAPDWEPHREALEVLLTDAGKAVSGLLGVSGEASVLLTDDGRMQELNRAWRGKDRPTDVLAFEAGDDARPFLGDIAISYGVASGDAASMAKALGAHIAHLTVHGLLHLVGYTHDEDAAAEEMEALERRALEKLGLPDPYSTQLGAVGSDEQKSTDAT